MPEDISIILFVYSPKSILFNLYVFNFEFFWFVVLLIFIFFSLFIVFMPKMPSSLLPNEYTICSFDNIKLCSFPQDADIAFIFLLFLDRLIGSLILSWSFLFGKPHW